MSLTFNNKSKALFLDRDGVINVDHGYVYKPEEFEFIADVFSAVKAFSDDGFLIVVITNQSGIGRGYYSESQFDHLTQWMMNEFNSRGITISTVKFCPHHPKNAQPEYLMDCDCRKPAPGMILDAISELNIDPAQSIFVGDKESDMKAASSANVQFKYLVESGQTFSDQQAQSADAVFSDLSALTQYWFNRSN